MCGIVGVLNWSGKAVLKQDIKKMTDKISHRGPDGEGFYIDKNIGLGHRRLSIIDLSTNASQPMTIQERYTITFNGEIYNYIELKLDLLNRGYKFYSDSDTEVLLNSFIEYGHNCLDQLDGMFAFAIWDNEKNELFCARDRFGEKPFFYRHSKSDFIFASEIKSIFSYGISREVNYGKLHNYMLFNTVHSLDQVNETYYKDIYELEAAHYIVINKNGVVKIKEKYWDIDLNKSVNYSIDEAVSIFQEKFNLSISRRLRSDVDVGSSLSGGLDSSAIVYAINQMKSDNQNQNTFSARFKNFELDEGKHMNTVINSIGSINPHFIFTEADLIVDEIDNIFKSQESPIISPGIIVQNQVMKLAKKNNIKVLLDGQGADEIAAGYPFYYKYYLMEKIRSNFFQSFKSINEINLFNKSLNISMDSKLLSETYFPNLSSFLRKEKHKRKPIYNSLNSDFLHNNVIKNPFNTRKNLNEALYSSTRVIGLKDLLKYADRNSMANSVEVRLPFLSHDLVEFIFSLPSDMKIHKGWTKYIIRKAFDNKLPNEITWRKDKIGYMPPIQRWMEDKRVKEMINESISFLKKEKIIDKPIKSQGWTYLMAGKLIKNDL